MVLCGIVGIVAAGWMVIRFASGRTSRSHDARPELRELVDAWRSSPQRAVEGRLTGGFAHAPLSVTRGTAAPVNPTPDVRIALGRLEKAAALSPESASMRAALGAGYLSIGDVTSALAALEEAAALEPANAAFQSDLAVAYIERVKREHIAEDCPRALRATALALRANPNAPVLLFNRAVALETAHLLDEARAAWRRYISAERDPEWRAEGEHRLDALDRAAASRDGWTAARSELLRAASTSDAPATTSVVQTYRQASREWLEDEALPEWGRACLANAAADVDAALIRIRTVASALTALSGDAFHVDVAAELGVACRDGRAKTLAEGYVAWREAKTLYNASRISDSEPSALRALQAFTAARALYRWPADVQMAIVDYQARRLDAADTRLRRVMQVAVERGHDAIAGQTARLLGLIAVNRGRYEEAQALYEASLRHYERLDERENVATVRNSIAENLRSVGDLRGAWRYQMMALEQAPHVRDARRRQAIYSTASLAALRQNLPEAALSFQTRYLAAAKESSTPLALAEAYIRRATILASADEHERGLADVATARTLMERQAADTLAGFVEGAALEAEGELYRGRDSRRALAVLDRAIEYSERHERLARLPFLFLARGRTHAAQGADAEAERDFRAGLVQFERQNAQVGDDVSRVSHVDDRWDLYAELAFQLARAGRSAEASDVLDRGRAAAAQCAACDRRGLHDVPAAPLREGTTVISFAIGRAELLRCSAARGRSVCDIQRLDVAALGRAINRYRAAVLRGETTDALAALAGPLRPVLDAFRTVPSGTHLVVVPDGSLHLLPFATLRHPVTGRLLIEEHSIAFAQSVRGCCDDASSDTVTLPGRVAVLANPRLDRARYPDLADLPEAEQEGRRIASIYPKASVAIGGEATRASFLRALEEADVVHFAGHALVSLERPEASRLLLSADGDEPADLTWRDLSALRRVRTRTLVLGACDTAVGAVYRGAGPMDLARPFLWAGVETVLGTLWPVDDRATADVLAAFHAHLARGLSPAMALARAQRDMAARTDRFQAPVFWAAFVLISQASESDTDGRTNGKTDGKTDGKTEEARETDTRTRTSGKLTHTTDTAGADHEDKSAKVRSIDGSTGWGDVGGREHHRLLGAGAAARGCLISRDCCARQRPETSSPGCTASGVDRVHWFVRAHHEQAGQHDDQDGRRSGESRSRRPVGTPEARADARSTAARDRTGDRPLGTRGLDG